MEPTVAAATPSRTGSPATTSLPPLPTSATVIAAPHRPSGNQRGAPESTSDTVLLPPLAPATSVLSDGRATATGASFPGGLPSLTTSHVTSSAADVGEREAVSDGEEARRQTGATPETKPLPCSASSSTALTPTPPSRNTSGAADTTARPPPPASSSSAAEGAPPRSQPASGPYFRENNVPHLFNELSEALLEARPEDPVAFMTEWLRQRRDALA